MTKFLHNVNNPAFKGLCKFWIGIPVWQLSKVQKVSIHFYCSSHDGGQKNVHQLIFPCNITENSPTLLAHNSIFICPKTSFMILYRLYQNYRKIDHNLCDYYQWTDVLFVSWTQHILWRQLIPGDYLSKIVSGEEVQHYFKKEMKCTWKISNFT